MGTYRQEIGKTVWTTPVEYSQFAALGSGTFGTVCSAIHTPSGTPVAIKKLINSFAAPEYAKRTYRELMLLKGMQHDNIISLLDAFSTTNPDTPEAHPDVYLVTTLMPSDLFSVLHVQSVSDKHAQFIVYQILRGLKYLHSAGVIHRDLKPSNIAINQNCDIKILDFGLARPSAHDNVMTGYVQTRWYRAVEIMLGLHYDSKVDMWSVGCILAEIVCGRVLLEGFSPLEQMSLCMDCLGPLPEDVLASIESAATRQFFIENNRPQVPEKTLAARLAGANPLVLDLCTKLLQYRPHERLSVEQALEHPYFAESHDPADEPVAGFVFDDAFEAFARTVDEWKAMILSETRHYG